MIKLDCEDQGFAFKDQDFVFAFIPQILLITYNVPGSVLGAGVWF